MAMHKCMHIAEADGSIIIGKLSFYGRNRFEQPVAEFVGACSRHYLQAGFAHVTTTTLAVTSGQGGITYFGEKTPDTERHENFHAHARDLEITMLRSSPYWNFEEKMAYPLGNAVNGPSLTTRGRCRAAKLIRSMYANGCLAEHSTAELIRQKQEIEASSFYGAESTSEARLLTCMDYFSHYDLCMRIINEMGIDQAEEIFLDMLYSIEEYLRKGKGPEEAITCAMRECLQEIEIDPKYYTPFAIAVWDPDICASAFPSTRLWTSRGDLEVSLTCGKNSKVDSAFQQAFMEMEGKFRTLEPDEGELCFG